MKVAVSSIGPDVHSEIDQRFGRAKYFVVVDTDTGEFKAYDNQQNLNALQGAGIQSARNVIALEVEALISGHIGPKAFYALKAGNVKIYSGVTGTVKEVVAQLKADKLQQVDQADVEGHWV